MATSSVGWPNRPAEGSYLPKAMLPCMVHTIVDEVFTIVCIPGVADRLCCVTSVVLGICVKEDEMTCTMRHSLLLPFLGLVASVQSATTICGAIDWTLTSACQCYDASQASKVVCQVRLACGLSLLSVLDCNASSWRAREHHPQRYWIPAS